MAGAVAQALNSLIPSLSGPLPPELVELATSLLAQSRSKASSLKADEEIARCYACANVACERLKQTLALPKTQPRPPCHPKVYQKLYKYMESALPAGTRKSGRATRLNGSASTPTSSPAKPSTPAKAAHVRPDIPRRKTPQGKAVAVREVPAWVMPAIRQLCKRMSTPAPPHHIFAGVSSILSSQDTGDAIAIDIPALIAALYSLVTTRLAGIQKKPAEYSSQMTESLNILNELVRKDVAHKDIEEADVDKCMTEIRDRQWTKMDWFANIPVGSGVEDGGVEAAGDASGDEEAIGLQLLPVERKNLGTSESADQNYLQAGLGTMMQDRVDYLSDDRRHDYQIWKEAILIRIDELEKGEEMDLEAD